MLSDLTILDLSRVLAGPYATQTLADLGATVWKIESLRGDDTRGWGPPFAVGEEGERASAYFLSVNRGKQGLAIDLKDPRGADLVRALARRADVVIENFKVGDLERYGLDAATLRAADPRLVVCSITGFGQTGPRRYEAGYDASLQAMSGVMAMTGHPETGPAKVGVAWIDVLTGTHAAIAILAALRRRDRTGEGATIDLALFDVALASLVNQAQAALLTGEAPKQLGSAHPTIVPYGAFDASDAPFVIACGNDGQFARLCRALDLPELALDARFRTNAGRVVARDALLPTLAARVRERSRSTWLAVLRDADVPATPVNDVLEAFADPQVDARGMRTVTDHPGLGPLPGVASPFGPHAVPPSPSPRLGEHTASVLTRELGLAQHELDALARAGVLEVAA
ncbi:MAG: CoA transferase [Trueperaceae bacterium]|nr:CoA transferase [Trueperaceae bacterium]